MKRADTIKNQNSAEIWSFPATIALTALIWLIFNLIGFVVVKVLLAGYLIDDSAFRLGELDSSVSENGQILALVTLVSAPLCIGLSVYFIYLRHGLSVTRYLALRPVKASELLRWTGILIVSLAAIEIVGQILDHPVDSDYVTRVYESAVIIPLFWLAVTLVGPVFEEVVFRGFMYKGIADSRLGVSGAILLTSMVWTIVHFQYDRYQLVIIFVLGILLGLARAKTHSLYVPLALHALVNITALVSAAYYAV